MELSNDILFKVIAEAVSAEDAMRMDRAAAERICRNEQLTLRILAEAYSDKSPPLIQAGQWLKDKVSLKLNDPIGLVDEETRLRLKVDAIGINRNFFGNTSTCNAPYGPMSEDPLSYCREHLTGDWSSDSEIHLRDGRKINVARLKDEVNKTISRVPLPELLKRCSPRDSIVKMSRFLELPSSPWEPWAVPTKLILDEFLAFDASKEPRRLEMLKRSNPKCSEAEILQAVLREFVFDQSERFPLTHHMTKRFAGRLQFVFPFFDAKGILVQVALKIYDFATQTKFYVPVTAFSARGHSRQFFYCVSNPKGQMLFALDRIAAATEESVLIVSDSLSLAAAINGLGLPNLIGTGSVAPWEFTDLKPLQKFPNPKGIIYLITNHSGHCLPGVVLAADDFRLQTKDIGIDIEHLIMEVQK